MSFDGDNMMSIKRTNRSAALRLLHANGGMSRKRMAENLKLTPAAINSSAIGYTLSPRINAAGRLESAMDAFELFTTSDSARAAVLSTNGR